jgi:hypothetical protein
MQRFFSTAAKKMSFKKLAIDQIPGETASACAM